MNTWPKNKKFAFTIIDDTDNSTIENIKPVYDYLTSKGILATKTIWIYPPNDHYSGSSLRDQNYLEYIKELKLNGFDIQLHNVGSGKFKRDTIIKGLKEFKLILGTFPKIHINHSQNTDNLYWGYKRHVFPFRLLFGLIQRNKSFEGEESDSPYFWGDWSAGILKYTRNYVFNDINTLKMDPKMPWRDTRKPLVNYWFSSSDGHSLDEFISLLEEKNIQRLSDEGGACIVYTHFASGFVAEDGTLNQDFKRAIDLLSKHDAWFTTATELLDFLVQNQENRTVKYPYLLRLNTKWLIHRIIKKIKFKK